MGEESPPDRLPLKDGVKNQRVLCWATGDGVVMIEGMRRLPVFIVVVVTVLCLSACRSPNPQNPPSQWPRTVPILPG